MSSWDMGYHSSSLYLHYYHYVFNPLWIKFILTANGCRVPNLDHGYACELGIGQGVSINMHALTSTTNWYGTDFNPSQVSFAQNLIPNGLENMHLYDDSFEQFAKRDDLPDFNYIVIHGIWSWISPENQQYLIDFVNKHLKVGGVLFLSYNIAPGHTPFEPIRHFMKQYMDQMLPHTLSDREQIQEIANLMQELIYTKPMSFGNYPNFPVTIKNFFAQKPSYLMNEYFNQAWDITHFGIIEEKLDSIKLKFIASAHGNTMIDPINFDEEQLNFLAPLAGTAIFEDLKDFMLNKQFRADIFVKGPTFLTPMEQEKAFQEFSAIRMKPVKEFTYQIERNFDSEKIELAREIYEPVLNFFADYQVHSFGEVIAKLQGTEHNGYTLTDQDVVDALLNLTALQELNPAYPVAEQNQDIIERCQQYNRDYLINRSDCPATYLASPLTASAIPLHEILLTCLVNYFKNPNITIEELKAILRQSVEDKYANESYDPDRAEQPDEPNEATNTQETNGANEPNGTDESAETTAAAEPAEPTETDAPQEPKLTREERKQKRLKLALKLAEESAEEFINYTVPCYHALKLF